MTDSQVKKIVFEDGLVIRTKADIAALYRNPDYYMEGEVDMLADLMGADLDNDPLAFLIAAGIQYYGDMYRVFGDQGETSALLEDYKKRFPKATERALSLKKMSGNDFYAKYGEEVIWEWWRITKERTGVKLADIIDFENVTAEKAVVQAGEHLKSAIVWAIASDWLDDVLEFHATLDIDQIAYICGED